MKERPILFSGAMVRAVLDGRKTQTRRIVKPQPELRGGDDCVVQYGGCSFSGPRTYLIGEILPRFGCPYGQPGDRLWVRETWSADFANHYPNDRVWYAADDDRHHDIEVRDGVRGIFSPESGVHVPFRWRPSIHMPRWASRILLEITGVRVERLQDISEEDALAEGVFKQGPSGRLPIGQCVERATDGIEVVYMHRGMAVDEYRALWGQLNGPGAWEANPYKMA